MTVRKLDARAKRKSYGFNEFPKGRGRIKCELCGLPIRDHEIGTHNLTRMQGPTQ